MMELSEPKLITQPIHGVPPVGLVEREPIFEPTVPRVILRVASAIDFTILLRRVVLLTHPNIEVLAANCPSVIALTVLDATLHMMWTPY